MPAKKSPYPPCRDCGAPADADWFYCNDCDNWHMAQDAAAELRKLENTYGFEASRDLWQVVNYWSDIRDFELPDLMPGATPSDLRLGPVRFTVANAEEMISALKTAPKGQPLAGLVPHGNPLSRLDMKDKPTRDALRAVSDSSGLDGKPLLRSALECAVKNAPAAPAGPSRVAVTPAVTNLSHALTCEGCGVPFTGVRADARYCSNRCRQRAYRERNG